MTFKGGHVFLEWADEEICYYKEDLKLLYLLVSTRYLGTYFNLSNGHNRRRIQETNRIRLGKFRDVVQNECPTQRSLFGSALQWTLKRLSSTEN